jgi:hypothetical protein
MAAFTEEGAELADCWLRGSTAAGRGGSKARWN